MSDHMDTTGNLSLGLPMNNADSGYFYYYPTYSCYQDEQDYSDELANKRLIYRNIPYYNNELKSLEDIDRSGTTDQMVDRSSIDPMVGVFYGNPGSIQADSYNNQALNKYGNVTRLSCDENGYEKNVPYNRHNSFNRHNPFNGHVSFNRHYERHGGYDRSGPYERHNGFYTGHYDGPNGFYTGKNGDVKKIKLSDLIKLTEAMRELTSRLPMPPSQELLQSVNPSLAATLQLTYLKAYIQNQQLLLDLKSSLEGSFPVDKYNPSISAPTSTDLESFGLSLARMGSSDLVESSFGTVKKLDGLPKIGNVSSDTKVMENVPKISDVSGDDLCVESINSIPGESDYLTLAKNVSFPEIGEPLHERKILPITNGDQNGHSVETHSAHNEHPLDHHYGDKERQGSRRKVEPRGTNVVSPDPSCAVTGSLHTDPSDVAKGDLPGRVPKELKKFVKYDTTKNSYVAVFLGPTGLRKRKAFSVRKFGADGALKRAETFALGSSGITLAVKERGLLEQICTTALQLNPKSREDIKLYEHAQTMEHYRGLVYSCGGQMWLSVYYDSLSKRGIKGFLVSEYGFQGAYDAAKKFLETREHTVQSKLSGALSFWLENDGNKVLCLIVPLKGVIRQVNACMDKTLRFACLENIRQGYVDASSLEETRLCIGRFELDVHGGFVKTRKVAQDWCNAIKSGSLDVFCTGSPNVDNSGCVDASKLPGVVYESSIDCWIANCNGKGKRFYVKTLGASEARRKAVQYRNNFLSTQRV